MTETKHFGRMTAQIDHGARRVVLTLATVKAQVFDVETLVGWARQALPGCADYHWVRTWEAETVTGTPPQTPA